MKTLASCVVGCWLSSIGIAVVQAEPVAWAAESPEEYDLIAKVVILSVDSLQEVKTHDTSEAQTYAHPIEVKIMEALRMPEGATSPMQLLVPSYSIYKGSRLECPLLESISSVEGKSIAVACRFDETKKWLLLDSILTDEMWETYQNQKESGTAGEGEYPSVEETSELENAIKADRMIFEKANRGEISWEEYHKQAAPFRTIINRQFGEIEVDY